MEVLDKSFCEIIFKQEIELKMLEVIKIKEKTMEMLK